MEWFGIVLTTTEYQTTLMFKIYIGPQNSLSIKFLEDIYYFSWCHWLPCFRLFVTSALGFKDKMDPFTCIHVLSPVCDVFLTFPSGATSVNLSVASMAADPLTHILSKHWCEWDPNPCQSVWQTGALTDWSIWVRIQLTRLERVPMAWTTNMNPTNI